MLNEMAFQGVTVHDLHKLESILHSNKRCVTFLRHLTETLILVIRSDRPGIKKEKFYGL